MSEFNRRPSISQVLNAPILVTLIVLLSIGSAMAQEGLVERWNFQKQSVSGREIAAISESHRAKIVGEVSYEKEAPHSLRFTGTSKPRQYVSVGRDLPSMKLPTKQITVSAWVKIDKPLEWGGIVSAIQDNGSFERGWLLGYRRSRFCFGITSRTRGKLTYLSGSGMFEPGNWYFVVGTYDGKTQQLFVDGKLSATSTYQQGDIFYPNNAPFTIGAYHDDNEFYGLSGSIEQVSLWNRAMSAQEVVAEFQSRKSLLPGIDPVRPVVEDWPTYARDNQHTGISTENLQFPLHLKWKYQAKHAPQPAWPAPAKQDFWHNKQKLKARVTYDRAFHLVTVGSNVYYASSSEDQVYCLDANTGDVRWRFFAEGPVRLAPTVAKDRVLFGSDDGCVYCLGATDGKLQWKHRIGPSDRRIPGNSRIISVWPVRTNVLVEGDTAYFCAGLFPSQGVFQAAIDIPSGKRLAVGPVNVSAQGYLSRRSARLYVPTGRDPAGAFVAELSRRGKGVSSELRIIPDQYPHAFIGSANARFGGGDGEVAAFNVSDGQQLWHAKVDGKAYSMAIARGQLFVSTDQGAIYCFSNESDSVAQRSTGTKETASHDRKLQQRVTQILNRCPTKLGYCLVLGSSDGKLARELARQSKLKIIGVESDKTQVDRSRSMLAAEGYYGRVSIHHLANNKRLPYSDYLFNLIVQDEPMVDVSRDEVERVLRPHGGIAVLDSDQTKVLERGPLDGIGEWTHMYANAANTVCSSDEHVGGKLALQWFGPPGPRQMLDRHHRTIAPVSKDGRVFIPGNNVITAADAYNGTVLWTLDVPESRRIGVFRDSSYLVAGKDSVYVAAADSCWVLDAQTGKIRRKIKASETSKSKHWGYLANVEDLLIGTTAHPLAARRGHSRQAIDDTFWDHRPLVGSDSVFVANPETGEKYWHYQARSGLIINPTLTVSDGLVVFVESANRDTLKSPNGRATAKDLLAGKANLVALDVRTGSIVWRKKYDFSNIQHNIFISGANGKLVVVGSRNDGEDRKQSRVRYEIHVVDAKTGNMVWNISQQQPTGINGDHGEQDHHPVIVGDNLYCEPFAYKLDSGKPLANWKWKTAHRRGCGTISASANSFFFRQSNPTMFDLKTNAYSKVTTTTRPGCWINMIPTGGLLLIPEASSGCTCNYAVQTSLAFLPVR